MEVFYGNRSFQEAKDNAIFFDEDGDITEVMTHNTDLKNRLRKYASQFPDLCKQTDNNEQGGLTFEIQKKRLSIKLTAPYTEERRRVASNLAKKHTKNLRRKENENSVL